jgi:hypothetical protein
MTTLEVLKAARELIATPDKWSQGAMARNADGRPVWAAANDAVCFCAEGAIQRAGAGMFNRAFNVVVDLVETGDPLHRFNDASTTSHEDILALFDRAIAAEESRT